jgi:hypothetical protein
MGNEPAPVGVPEMIPAALNTNPAGNAPDSVQTNGGYPAVAVKVKL